MIRFLDFSPARLYEYHLSGVFGYIWFMNSNNRYLHLAKIVLFQIIYFCFVTVLIPFVEFFYRGAGAAAAENPVLDWIVWAIISIGAISLFNILKIFKNRKIKNSFKTANYIIAEILAIFLFVGTIYYVW